MNKAVLKLLVVLICTLVYGALDAAPAPWWKWRSKIDGQLVCSQSPLGEGWERAYGPFRDGRCEKLIVIR